MYVYFVRFILYMVWSAPAGAAILAAQVHGWDKALFGFMSTCSYVVWTLLGMFLLGKYERALITMMIDFWVERTDSRNAGYWRIPSLYGVTYTYVVSGYAFCLFVEY